MRATAEAKDVLVDNDNLRAYPRRKTKSLHVWRYGTEVHIDSFREDGTGSWVVISRGVNRYVTYISEG